MKKTKEIVVVSGKGGTGKTTLTASLAELRGEKITVDADVDAANLFLLMNPRQCVETEFWANPIAQIDHSTCTDCQLCQKWCRFKAIIRRNGFFEVDPIACDGCRLCISVCPSKAIKMIEQVMGKWMISETDFGDFLFARLKPGGENSGRLVTMIRRQARLLAEEKNIKTILIDGPPGIGCPVISSLSGSDYALIVTEPTFSAINDLERIVMLIEHFEIPRGMVINRHDINPDLTRQIEKFSDTKKIDILAKIPHSFCILEEISNQRIPLKNCPELEKDVKTIHDIITKVTEQKKEV